MKQTIDTDKLIEQLITNLKHKRYSFIGHEGEKSSQGFKDGLSWAIDSIETVNEQLKSQLSNPPLAEKREENNNDKIWLSIYHEWATGKYEEAEFVDWLKKQFNAPSKLNTVEGEVVMDCEGCGKKFIPKDSFQCDTCLAPQPLTIDQAKDQVAKGKGLDGWPSVERLFEKGKLTVNELNVIVNEAMELYSKQHKG